METPTPLCVRSFTVSSPLREAFGYYDLCSLLPAHFRSCLMKRHLVATMDGFLVTPLVSYLDIRRMCSRCRRDLVSRWPRPARHWLASVSSLDGSVEQISPDKNVNFHDATATFTVSPESRALSCGAGLPETRPCMPFLFPGSGPGQAWLIALRSGFLRTVPHGSALAFS
jgi:hypothetical protein